MLNSIVGDCKEVDGRDNMAWMICLSAGLFLGYEFFQLNAFDVINDVLRADFNLNTTQLSWLSSAFLWANILFLLPAGVMLDKFSTRHVILSAMSLCVIGTAGFAWATTFSLAFFFHFLTGVGNAFCFLSCVVLVSRWFPPRRQALLMGCIVTMAFLGGMMAHTPLAYLNETYGWRQALLLDAAAGVIILLWLAFILKDRPDVADNVASVPGGRASFLKILCNPQNGLAGLYTACLNLPIMVLCALWGASYLRVVHGLSAMAASNVVSLIFIGSVIGCPLVGWMSDVMGRRKPLMLMGGVATLLTLCPLFMNIALSTLALSGLFFALGFFTSTQVISYPFIAESNSRENTGVATGVASMVIVGGGAVAQLLFGWLMNKHAGVLGVQDNVADFQYAMWLFPLSMVIALVCVMLMRETHCKPLMK